MALIALRGAATVAGNESEAILSATEELMREVLERNHLEAGDLISCIFTLTDDLDAEFPAVAARRMGLSAVPLLCAREIPVYPAADGYSLGGDVPLMASNETPFTPMPEVIEAASKALVGVNRYPDPTNATLRRALSDLHRVPSARIAIGNGSCDILLAAGEALLEPGAEVVYAWPSFSVYPHLAAASGATAVTVDLDGEDRHDLNAMADAVTVATRLLIVCNPNNPTSTALPSRDVAALLERVPPYVCVV